MKVADEFVRLPGPAVDRAQVATEPPPSIACEIDRPQGVGKVRVGLPDPVHEGIVVHDRARVVSLRRGPVERLGPQCHLGHDPFDPLTGIAKQRARSRETLFVTHVMHHVERENEVVGALPRRHRMQDVPHVRFHELDVKIRMLSRERAA